MTDADDAIARLADANEARTPGEKCEPRYGSCALLAGHRGPHHGYPEDVAALRAAWEFDILDQFVQNMPATGDAPDFISVLATGMLHVRSVADAASVGVPALLAENERLRSKLRALVTQHGGGS